MFELKIGNWKMMLVNHDEYECYIGCSGNQVYTDDLGNRYVPFLAGAKDRYDVEAMLFEPTQYVVVSPNGSCCELANAKYLGR